MSPKSQEFSISVTDDRTGYVPRPNEATRRRVLMISPHFPPDATAATHRVRLLAPHLPRYGWEPTILSVAPDAYEGRLDPELAALVPSELRVVRAEGYPVNSKFIRIGDLGLRSFRGLYRAAKRLLGEEHYDVLFITIFPMYTALIGALVKRQRDIPFVLDYIDPWVSAWGLTVGGGENGAPDLKSRISRWLAVMLEPFAVRHTDALTAVSAATYEQILARYPSQAEKLCAEIPYGGELGDFEYLRTHPRQNPFFDAADGLCHVCYLGTLLPLGLETLRAVLSAAARLRDRRPDLYRRLRFHFFGTSNQTIDGAQPRVLPVASELGVADTVMEIPRRIEYLDALTIQTQASAVLMMGSSERHYTASKLYPGLLAKRPVLAVYHEQSTVSAIVRRATQPPSARLVTYNDEVRAMDRVAEIADSLAAIIDRPVYDESQIDLQALSEFSALSLAGRLAKVFDTVAR